MSISQEEVKKRLEELRAQGGGIISGIKKAEIDSSSRILVIGLGGLGCKTVNAIAGVYKDEFVNQGRLSWLAIDTDQRCFDNIDSLREGNIDRGDMFSIYKPDVTNLLKFPRSPYIESFVDRNVPPEALNNQGARQRRIVGKTMLCGGSVFGELSAVLEAKIDALGGGPGGNGIQVIIVAGISGGTGSGTFIDVSYLVRELTKDNANNDVFGVFYTPDVQKNEYWCNAQNWDGLRRNGYASMKELDYFMNVGKNVNNKPVYTLHLNQPIIMRGQNVTKVESTLPIFERECVFMISETDTNRTERDIVYATAISLLNLFRASSNKNGTMSQNIMSNLCNTTVLGDWDNSNIGKSNDPNKSVAGGYGESSKIKYTDHPSFMHYNYASFDYRSVYVPRNEMAAYCMNLILNDLLHNKFEKAVYGISNADIDQFAQVCGLDSLESIYATASVQNSWQSVSLRIPDNSAAYPQPNFARVHCDATAAINEAKKIANNAISTANADMNPIWSVYENALNTHLFNNAQLWNLIGPYGVIRFMSGSDDNTISGLIQRVQNYGSDLNTKLQKLQEDRNNAENAMMNAKNALAEDNRVTNAEIVRMVDLCEAYSKAEYEFQLYAQAMPVVLNTIAVQLTTLNNRTFETYVPLMQAIEKIVNEDADRFMHSTLEKNGYGAVYRVDAFNIDNVLANSTLFEDFFRGYLNNTEVVKAEENLFSTLFNAENRAYWEALTSTDDPEQAANNAVEKVRQVFDAVTGPLINGMLEKFLVMVYCDPNTFRGKILRPGESRPVTLAELSEFWANNPQDRDAALNIAVDKILQELDRGGLMKFSVAPTVRKPFDSHNSREIVSIPGLDNLNQILRNRIQAQGGAFSVTDAAPGKYPKTEIALFKKSGPFPLPFINRMREYATRYFAAEAADATAAGRHGNEVTEHWEKNMPELYGVDAEKYFETTMAIQPISSAERPRGNHDQEAFDEISGLVKAATDGGYLYLSEPDNRYILVSLKKDNYAGADHLTVDELLPKIIDKLLNMLSEHDLIHEDTATLPTWVDAVKTLGMEAHHDNNYYLQEQYLDANVRAVANSFAEVQAVKPEFDYEISNLERLIRMDMVTLNLLREEVQFYQDKDFFGEIERRVVALRREQGLKDLVGYYLAAYKLGWISIDKGYLICKSADGKLVEALLDCRNGFGPGLDTKLMPFLYISAFCAKFENNEIAKKRINAAYAPYQLTDDLLTAEQKAVKDAMPDWKVEIMESLRNTMESDDFKDYDMDPIYAEAYRKYNLSRYKDTYRYPIAVNDGKDILDNVNKVIKVLEHFTEVGDNSLVPDLE